MTKQVYALLGISAKAGKLKSGEFSTLEAIRSGKAKLVIIAEDASAGTAEKFRNKCGSYQVPMFRFGEKETLGRSVGKEERSSLAILDEGLAGSLIRELSRKAEVKNNGKE